MKRESWAALTLGLVLAYGCAEPEELGNVRIITLGANDNGGDDAGVPGAGGTGGDAPGQGGTGPAPAQGGTGGTGPAPSTGGTGGTPGTGGTGGAPGTGGTAGAPGAGGTATGAGGTTSEPTGSCVPSGTLLVFYAETSNADQNIQMTLAVQNNGADFPTEDLTIRYWFTGGAPADFVGEIDYAANGTNQTIPEEDIDVTFGTELGSNFAEINIALAAQIGVGIQTIQLRIHNTAFSSLAPQTDDFSYVQDAASSANNLNITAYVAGQQVFGCEPAAN